MRQLATPQHGGGEYFSFPYVYAASALMSTGRVDFYPGLCHAFSIGQLAEIYAMALSRSGWQTRKTRASEKLESPSQQVLRPSLPSPV